MRWGRTNVSYPGKDKLDCPAGDLSEVETMLVSFEQCSFATRDVGLGSER